MVMSAFYGTNYFVVNFWGLNKDRLQLFTFKLIQLKFKLIYVKFKLIYVKFKLIYVKFKLIHFNK